MSDAFNKAINRVLRHEGGYNDIAQDAGGATNFGISLRFLKSIKRNPTKEDIQKLTREDAIDIYKKNFWDANAYYKITNADVAAKVFDLTVNMGAKQSHKLLQRAVRAASGVVLTVDGLLGSKTLQAVNAGEPNALLAALRSEAAGFYRLLNQPTFTKGWLKRAYS